MTSIKIWLASGTVEFRLLGPVECESAGGLVQLRRLQERSLLAVLAVEAGRIVPIDRLIELLWDADPPARARSIVQSHVSRLRTRLAAAGATARILARGNGYVLDTDKESVDLHRFRRLVEEARVAVNPAQRAAVLRTALALWRGPALADAATERIRQQICAGLEEARVAALEDRIEADLALGLHREVITELTDLVARYPLRERLVGLLMLARYRSGQQSQALDTYREARQALINELGIEPGAELRRLEQAILNQDPVLDAGGFGFRRPHDRPGVWRGPRSPLSSIIGRQRELDELTSLLADRRLVTVVGPGGVGKSTLAMHAAETLWSAEHRQVTVVALASLRTEEEIVLALGGLLGVVGATVAEARVGIARSLAEQPQLLVLDNCEHLIQPCARVVRELLSTAPGLVVLATSRQPIGLPEETVWQLEPLRVPEDDAGIDPEVPAVALFLKRARDSRAGFSPTPDEMPVIARICRRVDGLPLALELAASRLRTLTLRQLADQLDHGFELLSERSSTATVDRRHETLTAALDWSYRLLTDEEQRLLARVSVFRDSFTVEDARQVCGASPLTPSRVPEALTALVDRSLLQVFEIGGTVRYRLLQVVRDYAERRLAELGERDVVAGRHLVRWLERARSVFGTPVLEEQIRAWTALGPDIDNLRAALHHGYATDVAAATELTALTFDFWQVHDAHLAEGDRWINTAWSHLADCPPTLRCVLRYHKAVQETGRDAYTKALRLLRPGLPELRAHHPLVYLDALAATVQAEIRVLDPLALDHAMRMYSRLRRSADRHIRVFGLITLTEALVAWGRYAEASQVCLRDRPEPNDLAPSSAVRWYTSLCLAELGCGRFDTTAAAERQLRDLVHGPGSLVHLSTPARAIALRALCVLPPAEAVTVLTGIIDEITSRYTPTLSLAYRFAILLAEAERRIDPERARSRLAEVLAEVSDGDITNYHDLMPAVLTAALVAADLGDRRASRDLATGWDRVRRRLGLPAPLGYASAVAETLGLDPAAPPGPLDRGGWDERAIRDLIAQARRWCSISAAGRPRLPRPHAAPARR